MKTPDDQYVEMNRIGWDRRASVHFAVAEPYPQACCKGHRARPTSDRGPWICEASLDLNGQGKDAAETDGFPELIS